MEGESSVTPSVIDDLHSSDIQRDEMEGENGVTQSIIVELHSSEIEGDQMEGERGFTGRIIDGFPMFRYATRSIGR